MHVGAMSQQCGNPPHRSEQWALVQPVRLLFRTTVSTGQAPLTCAKHDNIKNIEAKKTLVRIRDERASLLKKFQKHCYVKPGNVFFRNILCFLGGGCEHMLSEDIC